MNRRRDWVSLTLALAAGGWATSSSSMAETTRGLDVAPELQWEFRRAWRTTPYAGLGFRYEDVWSDGVTATSKGGFLVGGWQFRSQSGFGLLLGGVSCT